MCELERWLSWLLYGWWLLPNNFQRDAQTTHIRLKTSDSQSVLRTDLPFFKLQLLDWVSLCTPARCIRPEFSFQEACEILLPILCPFKLCQPYSEVSSTHFIETLFLPELTNEQVRLQAIMQHISQHGNLQSHQPIGVVSHKQTFVDKPVLQCQLHVHNY